MCTTLASSYVCDLYANFPFPSFSKALERPLTVRLCRGGGTRGSGRAGSETGTLSAVELAERRERNQRAADARSSAWEKRVQTASRYVFVNMCTLSGLCRDNLADASTFP